MKAIIFFSLLIFPYISFSQTAYGRLAGETDSAFVTRYFPAMEMEYNVVHKVISGKWGNTAKRKLFFAYREEWMVYVNVLQEDSAGYFSLLPLTEEFYYIGSYSSSYNIRSVFYYDYDKDGYKELVLVEYGVQRCEVELEEEDIETGRLEKHTTIASCDAYAYTILGQQKINKKFTDNIEVILRDDEVSPSGGGDWTAGEVKAILNGKK